ncbi:ABC transporter permease [Desmospora profundinema]|uniref:ABC transporter permease n=1 Tax=Desmospora profundinema TaxID=1571184 RepID=A0ABU1IPE6_9BACL|nr:ABC transporter permease [Desmospora profundinema]MDR6226666.1 hypothetical protein [Desmospora profundinema]
MVMREVLESLKRRKLFACLIGFGLMVFFFAVTVLFQNYIHIEAKGGKVESFQGLSSYELGDTLFEDSDWKEYLNEPNALERVRRFYGYLEENLGEKYLHIHTQSIALSPGNVKWDEKLLHGHEDGDADKVKERSYYKEKEGPYYAFKAVQMNKQAFDSFTIDVSEGEALSPEDFDHNNNPGVIPVLLGSEYQSIYQVGDQLTAEYLFKDFQLEIKGFIPSNTFVSEIYLDRYIVIPAQQFDAPVDEEEWDFQRKHYFNLINGSIYSAEGKGVIVGKLEKIKTKSDFPHIMILGVDDSPLENLFAAIQTHIQWVMILAGVLFVGCILSISILMMTKIQDNYKNMSIHLISGATMNQLLRYVLAEVLVLVSIPALLMILLYMGSFSFVPPLYLLLMVMCIFILTLLSAAPIYLQFRKLPISRLLKRAE